MVKHALRWTVVVAGSVAAVAAVRRVRRSRSGSDQAGGAVIIGGDTWPPVPVKPKRVD